MTDAEEHRHCKVCGRVCDLDEETCSQKCADQRERVIRNRRNLTYLLYASIALVIIVFLARLL